MGKKRRSRNKYLLNIHLGFSGGLVVKNPPASAGDTEMRVPSLGQEGPLEKEMVTHSSILIWRIPRTEESGRLQSIELQRVGRY